jgi:hypothetical protein
MAFINTGAFDAALNYIKNGVDRLDICDQEPNDVTGARNNPGTGNSLGNEVISSSNTTGPQVGDVDGRELQINAIDDGDVTATGTASHWALSNSTVLLATGSLQSSQAVTVGNKFTLGAFDITIRDAT